MALGIQFALYASLLQAPLRSRDIARARPALSLWMKVAAVWQGLVLLGAGGYVVLMSSHHTTGVAWVAPALAAVLGTALPLQLVVITVLRAGRR